MKFEVYIYEGDLTSEKLRESLTMDAVGSYCAKRGINCQDMSIVRTEKG